MKDPRFEPLPQEPSDRIKRFVRDLAYGAENNLWSASFAIHQAGGSFMFSAFGNDNAVKSFDDYIAQVWNGSFLQPYDVMASRGYFDNGTLTNKAFALLDEPTPASVFISYRRKESSALALLIVCRMKEHGLTPFLDMHPSRELEGTALTYGEDWANELKG